MTSLKNLEVEKLFDVIDSCGKAQASSLSKMLNEPLRHNLRAILQTGFYNIEEIIPKFVKQEVCAIYVGCEGDLRLEILFFLDIKEARKLASQMVGGRMQQGLVGIAKSSISEVGNIMAGTFLNALSSKTDLRIQASIPGLAIDFFEAVLETPLARIVKTTDELIVIESEFRSVKERVVIRSIVILEPEGARKILERINDDMM